MSDQMTREVVCVCVQDIDFIVKVAYYPESINEWEEEGIFTDNGEYWYNLSDVLQHSVKEEIIAEVDREIEASYP